MAALTLHLARLVFAPPQRDYEVHADLCQALGGARRGRYLFRSDVDRREKPGRRVVLVQSVEPADLARMDREPLDAKTGVLRLSFEPGGRYRFFLRANVTRAKKAALKELANVTADAYRAARGKRTAVRGDEALRGWLDAQAKKSGFRVVENAFPDEDGGSLAYPALRIIEGRDLEWRTKSGRHGVHGGADFEGILEVVDPEALAGAVVVGIGPGKAFGYGLLSVARIS